jgi:hypothetical protein
MTLLDAINAYNDGNVTLAALRAYSPRPVFIRRKAGGCRLDRQPGVARRA